jgi:hypothetical protein
MLSFRSTLGLSVSSATLFLTQRLANWILAELQATAEYPHSYETWFQIGSIHGLPRDPWDNAPSKPEIPFPNGEKFIGYCAHKTQTFPTWHRPYVTLFEVRQ